MKALVVLGEGGHTKEMVTLVEMLGADLEYGYLMVDEDQVSAAKITRPGPIYRVMRPRDKEHHLMRDILRTLFSAWQSWSALREFRPDVVLSSGPSVAVPVCVLARLSGVRVVFIETGSRVTALSFTGRIMYRVANLFFVQWPELAERYSKAVYAGRLF
ncbi:MAG: hypothetical protein H5T69_14885 [Chloroflexi bacterium]|nr:hypothetical protein [Chloroflexota bacterium]